MAEISLDNLINGSQGKFWNYGNQQKDDCKPELTGTLVEVSIAQAHEFGHPEIKSYWPDGNPMILLRLHIMDPEGEEYLFDVKPKSSMWFEDLQPACPEGSLSNVLGSLIKLTYMGLVQVPGRAVNRNKFQLQILGPGQFESRGFNSKMPPTKFETMGQQQQQPVASSPQQFTAQRMMNPQQQAQQFYAQQSGNQALQQAMASAQQAGAVGQAAMIQQQFPGAKVTTGYPGPLQAMPTASPIQQNVPAQDMQTPMEAYEDCPF